VNGGRGRRALASRLRALGTLGPPDGRLALALDRLDAESRVGEHQTDPVVGTQFVRLEERVQPEELTGRPEPQIERRTTVGIDGGDRTFGEGTLEAEGKLHGTAAHAHARQVDLEPVRWHGGRWTIHSTFATHALLCHVSGPGVAT
jgi:hypothetical protein